MSEGETQDAPDLGEPTDAGLDDGPVSGGSDVAAVEKTRDTPDEVGGTGGGQAGGAG